VNTSEKWRALGWKHPLWDYVRFYSVVATQKKELREAWEEKMREGRMEIDAGHELSIPEGHAELFYDYMRARDEDFFETATSLLRTEEEANAFCERIGAPVRAVKTKSQEHHQSSAAMVAAVSHIASERCAAQGLGLSVAPTRRSVWLEGDQLHVTARRLDGAIPSLDSPTIIWEIKEYWGKTKGGSKMSDAVYECALVGLELRDFEERTGASRVQHVVFVDGKDQWSYRKSDLKRFIDLFHQGIIDHLIVGREVETVWGDFLDAHLS
jgi:hypothetical protein